MPNRQGISSGVISAAGSARLEPIKPTPDIPSETAATVGDDRANRVRWIGIRAAVMLVGVAALTTLFYYASMRIVAPDSDSATVVLEGQAMAAGNLTLNSWKLSFDSFWGIDAIFNTIAVLIVGVRSELLYLVPCLIASLVVLVGILIACADRTRWAAVAGGVTVFALLGLPGTNLAYFFLGSVSHVGTALWCLMAFLLLSRRPEGKGLWIRWFVGVVFLAAGLLGDLQTVALGVAPVLVVGFAAMLRARSRKEGRWLVGASAASLVLALAIRGLAYVIGTYSIGEELSASNRQVLANLRALPRAVLHMFSLKGGTATSAATEFVHFVGLILVAVAIVATLLRLLVAILKGSRTTVATATSVRSGQRSWILDELLLFGCVGSAITFVKLQVFSTWAYDRYLTAGIIFGSILAGRLVGEAVSALKTKRSPALKTNRVLWPVAVFGLACISILGIAMHSTLEQPDLSRPAAQLGAFLESHGLHDGIGDYWSASITTVATDGEVTVRPVVANPTGKIVRYGRQSDSNWYVGRSFQFLVFSTSTPLTIDAAVAVANFGSPAHTYAVGAFRVLTWNHPLPAPQGSYDIG